MKKLAVLGWIAGIAFTMTVRAAAVSAPEGNSPIEAVRKMCAARNASSELTFAKAVDEVVVGDRAMVKMDVYEEGKPVTTVAVPCLREGNSWKVVETLKGANTPKEGASGSWTSRAWNLFTAGKRKNSDTETAETASTKPAGPVEATFEASLDAAKEIAVKASSDCMFARSLFVAITTCNAERESAGLCSVWPKSAAMLSGDKEDLSGMDFRDATSYFRELLNMDKFGKKDWSPYVGVDPGKVLSGKPPKSMWLVAKGVVDEMSDGVPVLVSANVDPSSLVTKPGSYKGTRLKGSLRFTGDYAVVVLKGGDSLYVKPGNAELKNVYKGSFVIPANFSYLAP